MNRQQKRFLSVVAIAIFAIACFIAFRIIQQNFDVDTQAVVDVITKDYSDGKIEYDAIGTGKRKMDIHPFESDPLQTCCADLDDHFSAYGTVQSAHLYDESGKLVDNTEPIERILEHVADIEHLIIRMKILRQRDLYFVVVELNVNWWSPCILYYYDAKNDQLVELYTYDDKEIVGIKVRNLSMISD